MKIFIQNNPLYYAHVKYVLGIFSLDKKTSFNFVSEADQADLRIDESLSSDLPVAIDFYKGLKENKFGHENYFKNDCIIYTADGKPDLLATCFYMINSLQEFNSSHKDKMGRFTFEGSYQHKFRNIKENLVQQYFDKLAGHPKFSFLQPVKEATSVFISHDIDNINRAWLEDGFAALKKGQVHHIFRLLFNAAIQKPDWFNMDKIMSIHNEHDLKSTFFWLANKGKAANGLQDADYDVRSRKVQQAISFIEKNGFENGIHKSISEESFGYEYEKLGFKPTANRYHYLKFSLPHAYSEMERAGIKLDASLGFSGQYGFRNSYGQPFQPFNMEKQKAFDLVEIPLHVMDRTLYYMHTPKEKIADVVIGFFEANKYNCTLSLLWHNNFFTSIKYDGYLEAYKKIITYFCDNKFRSLSQGEIVNRHLVFRD